MRLLPKATVMMGVPTFYVRLLARPDFGRASVRHMRLFVSGSAPLSAETHKEFSARTGHAILERYGMTETNMNTSNPYDGERIPGSVGFPLPGVEIRIADPQTGKALPQGEIGVIDIRGANVFKGYWRMPDKTKEEFRADGFFISGDLGYIDQNGYVYISGTLSFPAGITSIPPRSNPRSKRFRALPNAQSSAFPTPTLARPSWPSLLRSRALNSTRNKSNRQSRVTWQSTSSQSASSSPLIFHGMLWGRSRKKICAKRTTRRLERRSHKERRYRRARQA
jgi:hypothetical protein